MIDWKGLWARARPGLAKTGPAVAWTLAVVAGAWGLVEVAIAHRLFRAGGPIDQWQTLIAGALAIGAAFIGGAFVNGQVRLARQQEDERLRRRHSATRSTMPLTLSGLMEYARLCGRALRVLHLSTRGESIRAAQIEGFEIPPVPVDKITALAEIIEAGRPDVGKAIAKLLSQLQVQDGRLRSTKADILDPHNPLRSLPKVTLEDYILDVADLYARCEGMLDYAREESEDVNQEPSAIDLKRALKLMNFHEQTFDRLKATVDRRHGEIVVPIEGV